MPAPIIAAGAGLAGSIIAGKSKNQNVSGLAGDILGAGTGIAGSLFADRGSSRAADASMQANREALAFEREREMRRRQEYDQERSERRAQFEANERRLAPYRQAAASVLAKYGVQIPLNEPQAPPMGAPPPPAAGVPPMPAPMDLGSLGRGRYGF